MPILLFLILLSQIDQASNSLQIFRIHSSLLQLLLQTFQFHILHQSWRRRTIKSVHRGSRLTILVAHFYQVENMVQLQVESCCFDGSDAGKVDNGMCDYGIAGDFGWEKVFFDPENGAFLGGVVVGVDF